jgi:hypothetical protein
MRDVLIGKKIRVKAVKGIFLLTKEYKLESKIYRKEF